jgi:FMN phosphatase YigB (HAD superfamily)
MTLTLEQYADYLDTRRDLSWPAAPEVAKRPARPHLVRLPEVRLVTWSIYGTLLSIRGGELFFELPDRFMMNIALDKTVQEFKMWSSMTRKPGQPAVQLQLMYAKALSDLQQAPSADEKYPEILSEQIWESVIKKLLQKEYQFDVGFYGSLNEFSRKVAYFFHRSLQGLACQEGAGAALQRVRAARRRQGVVDNGQVFTIMELDRTLRQQEPAINLDLLVEPRLRVLSYEYGARKPSENLFQHLLDRAQEAGLHPFQVLHIGTDIEQDIVPAKKLGMRTGLYAGDKESLAATRAQVNESATRPDILLTELQQISEVLPEP